MQILLNVYTSFQSEKFSPYTTRTSQINNTLEVLFTDSILLRRFEKKTRYLNEIKNDTKEEKAKGTTAREHALVRDQIREGITLRTC